MFALVIRRLFQAIIVMLIVSMICFIIFRYLGDPVLTMAGIYATEEQVQQVRVAFGLDQPTYIQYGRFLWNCAHGNFGKSFVSRIPALDLILERLPASIELVTAGMFISVIMGISLGVVVSVKPHAIRSRFIMAGSLAGISIPTFLIGIFLIMCFAVYAKILPSSGRGDTVVIGFWRTGLLTWSGIQHLILPAFAIGSYQLAVLLRLTRGSMREILSEDYIKTAWSKGLSPSKVIGGHALRNALIPVVTIAGLQFGDLIVYSIVTETIFQWPGMGNLLLSSMFEADHPVIVLYVMIASVVIISANLVVDILYACLNPKIRYE